ncbi:YdcF family protein [Paenibacillus glycanilyticus]|uniref:YdcF family protein n=1 Tax=Paenibacillus glycanilyticus TaxID=126569 RepID=UPI00203E6B6B|nr:YdcF family protein [Paenibacillus glycanilyticus]MCM3630992.1 YdcF family protein [Paenibacillus glycanilyticus]
MIAFLVFSIGRFLVVNEAPKKADVIILLSGDVGRMEKAIGLLKQGYADRIIVTRTDGRGYGEIKLNSLIRSGVSPSAIIPEYQATNTYTNAVYSKALMEKYGFHSALVVSSNYHMRRVSYTFNKVYSHSGIDLTYVDAPSVNFDPVYWWSERKYVNYTISEYIKLFGYIIKY